MSRSDPGSAPSSPHAQANPAQVHPAQVHPAQVHPASGPHAPASPAPVADRRGAIARIRKAACALFLERGYEGTAMDAVAAAAPVSKRTLYHHFSGKAALFAAVVDEAWAHLNRSPPLPADAAGDPAEVLRGFVVRLTEHWERPDVIPLLRLVIAEAPRFPELSEAYFAAGKEPVLKGLTSYFTALAAQSRLAPGLEPGLAALQFLGAIKEPLFWPRVLGVPVTAPLDAVVGRAIAGVLRPADT